MDYGLKKTFGYLRALTCGLLFVIVSSLGYSQEVNDSIFQIIKQKALESHSDALIIKQGKAIVYEDYYGKPEVPIYIASAGKSLASLAIGKLLDHKLLDSLDQPIYTIYPEWKQGNKQKITVRMLLNHTSGIQNNLNASIELEPPPDYKVDDIIKLALSAELSDIPGQSISYNNKAVALLGGVVQRLSGKSFDHFFADNFFEPMGITQFKWIKDKSGNPTVHGAFIIKPSDLIKFGELILNKGKYGGKRIISQEWIDESLKQSQGFSPIWGLLWWRLPEYEKRIIDDEIWKSWKDGGIPEEFLKKIQPMKGVLYESKQKFFEALEIRLGQDWNTVLPQNLELGKRIYGDKITAYYANGYRGNYLVIVPESNIVAVRCADFEGFNYQTDFFQEFVSLVSMMGR